MCCETGGKAGRSRRPLFRSGNVKKTLNSAVSAAANHKPNQKYPPPPPPHRHPAKPQSACPFHFNFCRLQHFLMSPPAHHLSTISLPHPRRLSPSSLHCPRPSPSPAPGPRFPGLFSLLPSATRARADHPRTGPHRSALTHAPARCPRPHARPLSPPSSTTSRRSTTPTSSITFPQRLPEHPKLPLPSST